MVPDFTRNCLDTRVLVNNRTEPNLYLEIPNTGYGSFLDGTHAPCSLPGYEPRRGNDRYWRRG